ncbi:MAG: tyrosine-protein phosphatase [Gemmataceae bacterium]
MRETKPARSSTYSAFSRRLKWLLAGALAGWLLFVGWRLVYLFAGGNLHEVIPGQFYRSAQLSSGKLERVVARHGIRTVLNLRGRCVMHDWYIRQCQTTHRLNICQEDVCLSARRLPPIHEIRYLLRVLDRAEKPILIHCRRGADRTGVASVMAILLYTEGTLDDARRQLGPYYGHVRVSKAAYCDEFFDLYEDWLRRHGHTHAPALFREWVEHHYCPAECHCRIEPLDMPARVPSRQAIGMRARFHNTSVLPWRMSSHVTAGVHLVYLLLNEQGQQIHVGRAGLLDAEVLPGQFIDLTLALPPLHTPGRYVLYVDMEDKLDCLFFQVGSQGLFHAFEVTTTEEDSPDTDGSFRAGE